MIAASIVAGLVYRARQGGGIVILAFVFPITLFAAGAISGAVTRAFLLSLRFDALSGRGMVVVLVSFLVLPTANAAYGIHRQNMSSDIYSNLPTAHTLPMVPICDPFRETGRMIKTVMTRHPTDLAAETLPTHDIAILYPAAYREPFPRRFPLLDEKSSWIDFEMYISNAQPAPPNDETDANGKIIPLNKRRPSIHFHFRTRPPVADHAARVLKIRQGTEPDIILAGFQGLSLLRALPGETNPFARNFVAVRERKIEELVQCSGQGSPLQLRTG
ncbi:hypothetical protein ASE04_28700 [Rhizobium sp. Root708]|nr:hypothetical protein ASE04_28700 [Rhizobium sp. Root708]